MSNLSPEANNVLYGSPDGLPLADQLQAAYERNLANGHVAPRTAPESFAAVAAAAVAEAAAETPENAGFNLDRLTGPQRLAAEAILDQVEATYRGMETTIDALNSFVTPSPAARFSRRRPATANRLETPSEVEIGEALEATIMDWAERGILDYVHSKIEADPELGFTLVATPVPTAEQWSETNPEARLQHGFKEFAKKQPNATTEYIYNSYCKGYSREAICGKATPTQGLQFSLVPTKYSEEEVPTAVVQDQQRSLRSRQADNPELNYHVSSPLAQLTRLFTLREQQPDGQPLKGFALTFIRNFDLPIVDGRVPYSNVFDVGYVDAYQNGAGLQYESRVAVG